MVGAGPVSGGCLLMQIPLMLHHPEAFETFFIHASPSWVLYALRWRLWEHGATDVMQLLWAGSSRIYLPWLAAYAAFLLLQPAMPDRLAGYETMLDLWFEPPDLTRDARMAKRRQGFQTHALKVLAFVVLHSTLSLNGLVAAALSYQCQTVNAVWICCVIAGCAGNGALFYYLCARSGLTRPGFFFGFVLIGLTWSLFLPVFFLAC